MMAGRPAWTDNEKAAALASVAGVLMIISGVTGASQWQRTFALIEQVLGTTPLIRFVQLVFVAIGSVGGVFVVLAGYAFRDNRVRTGKILVFFGTGFTLVSLLVFIVFAAQRADWPFTGGAAIGFAGVVLSVAARWKAKPVPM